MEWDPKKKLAYWSEETQKPFRKQAEQLLSDLTHNQLRVILIPAPRPQFSGHKVRAVSKSRMVPRIIRFSQTFQKRPIRKSTRKNC